MAAQNPLNYLMGPLPSDETWHKRWRDTVSYATSASQDNGSAERNAQREREQRNRTARFQNINDSNPMQPLFKEPIKVDNSEDEISRRIQSTLGDFQSVKHFIASENLIGISSNLPLNGLYSYHSGHRHHYPHKAAREWKHHHSKVQKESPRPAPTLPQDDPPPLTNGLAKSALPSDLSKEDPVNNILQEMQLCIPPLISEIPSPEKKLPTKEIYSFNNQDQLLDQLDYLLEESSFFQPQEEQPIPIKTEKILGEDLQVSDSEDDQLPIKLEEATPPPPPPPVVPLLLPKQEEVEEELPPKPPSPSSDSSSAESEESSSGSESDEELPPPNKPAPQGWNLANFLGPSSPSRAPVQNSTPPPPPPPTSNKRKRGSSPAPPVAEAPPRTKRTKVSVKRVEPVSPPPPAPPEREPTPPPPPEQHRAIWVTIDLRLMDTLPSVLHGKVPGWKPFCLVQPNCTVEHEGRPSSAKYNHRTKAAAEGASRKKQNASQSPWLRPCDYLSEAPRAKAHEELDGPRQVLSYFDAIHQFISQGASMENSDNVEHDKLYALYKDTLTLLRYVESKYLREEAVPLSVLSYKCQAYLHYKLYLLRKGDVTDFFAKAADMQKMQQFRVPGTSPALPRSPHSPTPSPAGSVASQSSGYSSSELSRQSGGVPDVYYSYILRINHFLQHVHQATVFWEHAQGTFDSLSPPDKDLLREVGNHPAELSNFPLREMVGYMSTLLSRLRARLQSS